MKKNEVWWMVKITPADNITTDRFLIPANNCYIFWCILIPGTISSSENLARVGIHLMLHKICKTYSHVI